jgi:exodeoxyribonuclease VII large subunit
VLSGIGHSTNETVVEMVSHTNAITPTDLADHLIQKYHNFAVPLLDIQKGLQNIVRHRLELKRIKLDGFPQYIRSRLTSRLSAEEREVNGFKERLRRSTDQVLINAKNRIENAEKNVRLMDPLNVLKRGYSLTYCEGKLIKSVKQAKEGVSIETRLADGSLFSKVEKKSP